MANVVVNNSVTLDGVMQSPAAAEEDTRGDFAHGGWATPYADEELARLMVGDTSGQGRLLLGRRTYEHFASVWPYMPTDNPYTAIINDTRKLVASRTLKEPLTWQNSELLPGDAVEAVANLREQDGADMVILGSGDLIESLMRHGLIDVFVLLIHPLVLGEGRHMFRDGGPPATFELVDTAATAQGVLVVRYEAA